MRSKENFNQSSLKQTTLSNAPRAAKEFSDNAVAKFFFSEGIPFAKVNSPYFREMLRSVSKIPDYKPPNRHTLASKLLNKEYRNMREAVSLAFPPG